jgi:hypothetical protein
LKPMAPASSSAVRVSGLRALPGTSPAQKPKLTRDLPCRAAGRQAQARGRGSRLAGPAQRFELGRGWACRQAGGGALTRR